MVGLRAPGRVAWTGGALAVLAAVLLAVVHSAPVESRVQAWLTVQVKRLWRLDLTATDLDYNLLTRRATLRGVALSAEGHAGEPVFAARQVSVALPWAVFRGTLRLSSLAIDDGVVTLVRERGRIVNIPPPSGQPAPPVPRHLDLRGLSARNLGVNYVDRTGDIDVAVNGMNIELSEIRDRIGISAGGTIEAASIHARVGDHSTTSQRVQGRMGFDGSHVTLDRLTAPFREATLIANGRINRVLDDTSFDLNLEGTLDMAPLVEWAPPPVPVSGNGTFTGTMTGPLSGNEIRLAFRAPVLTIARATGLPLDGDVSITSARALVERFRLVAPGTPRAADRPGTIEGRAQYTFGAGAIELEAAFRDLDLDLALAANDQEPLDFAAWEDGSVTLTRAGPEAPRRIRAVGRSSPLARANRIALAGQWDAALQDGRWVAVHDHTLLDTVRASGTARWPDVVAPAPAPLTGPLVVETSDIGRAVRAARQSGIDVSESLESVGGPAQASFELGGTIDEPLVIGRAESPALVLPTGVTGTASADLVVGLVDIDVKRFDVEAQGVRLSGDARVEGEAGRLSGSFLGEVVSLPEFARPWMTDGADALSGTMRLTGTLGGTTEVPDAPWHLESTPLAHGELPIGTATADGRLVGTTVRIDRLRLDQGTGGVDANGQYDYDTGAYTASVNGKGWRVGQPFVGTLADALVVDLQFQGSGTVSSPGGGGFVRVVPEGGRIAELVGASETRLQLVNGRVETRTFVAKLRALVDAAVELRAPYSYTGTAVVNKLDVEPLALAAGAVDDQVSGTVDLSASFQGDAADIATATAFVNLQDVSATAAGVPLRLDRPARLTVRADDFSVDDLSLHVGAGQLVASGRLRDPIQAPLSVWYGGPVGDLVTMARVFGVATDAEASGELTASWESTGSVDRASATVTLRNGRVIWQDFPAIEALQADATYDGTMVAVENLHATWQGGGIDGRARLPRALLGASGSAAAAPPGRLDLTLRGLTQESLRPWLSADTISKLDGHVSATLALDVASADVRGLSGTLVLDEAAVTAAGVPITQARPGRMSIAGGVLHFDDVAFSAGQPVVVGGSVTFGETTTLDVTLTGTPGLRPLSVLSPQLAVDGVAKLDLRVNGTPDAPRMTGRVDLEDAEIVMRDPRVIASDIAGPILFEGDRIVVPGLTGTLNGGVLDASGTVTVAGAVVTGGELTLQARGVTVEYPDDVDSEIDALLVVVPGPVAPLVRGDVRVLRGSYRATISLPALVAFNRAAAAPAKTSAYLDAIRLDIAVSTEEDLLVDNNYGRFEAGANLRLQGTVGRPGVTGRAELREGGEIFLLGGLYRLNESSISFTNPTAIEPDLNISMTTRSSGDDTTLTLTGTLDRLETNVTSSNPDANQTVMSVLLGGNSLGREDALALLSGELLGVTGRAIGLDSLRVERGFDTDLIRQDPGLVAEDLDPSTRLTMSKRLRSDVEVILSQDLRQSGGLSAVISYRPLRNVELRAARATTPTARSRSGTSYQLRRRRAVPPPRRDAAEVAAVRFDGRRRRRGGAARSAAPHRGQAVRLRRWRDDVDRLRAVVSRAAAPRGAGAAVATPTRRRPRRADLPRRAAVPRRCCRWTARGASRPAARARGRLVGQRLRPLPARGAARARGARPVRRNLIGAAVEATVPEPADRKVVRMEVRGGEQVAATRCASGHRVAVDPATLEAAVTTASP